MTDSELLQEINVNVTSTMQTPSSSIPCINQITNDIKSRFDGKNIAQPINNDVARECVQGQRDGIINLDAKECGYLYNSIAIQSSSGGSNSAHSMVGTNMNHKYPLYLIHGRPAVKPIKSKVLKFSRRCKKVVGYARYASPTIPKNYMLESDLAVSPKIPNIVEKRCKSAFRLY